MNDYRLKPMDDRHPNLPPPTLGPRDFACPVSGCEFDEHCRKESQGGLDPSGCPLRAQFHGFCIDTINGAGLKQHLREAHGLEIMGFTIHVVARGEPAWYGTVAAQ